MNESDKPKLQANTGPEYKELEVFVGRWFTTGEVAATASTPAVKVDAIDTYEWYPGGFFLVHHADGKIGDEEVKSIEIIGYDPDQKGYFTHFFDNTGAHGREALQLDGNTWTWRGSNVMGVREHRCIAVISEDGNVIQARHERSDDGENWELWMNVTLKKSI